MRRAALLALALLSAAPTRAADVLSGFDVPAVVRELGVTRRAEPERPASPPRLLLQDRLGRRLGTVAPLPDGRAVVQDRLGRRKGYVVRGR